METREIRKNEQIVEDVEKQFKAQDELLQMVVTKLSEEIESMQISDPRASMTLANVAVLNAYRDFIAAIDSHTIHVAKMELAINKELNLEDNDQIAAIAAHLLTQIGINGKGLGVPPKEVAEPSLEDLDKEFAKRDLSVTDAEKTEVSTVIEGITTTDEDTDDTKEQEV